MEIARADLDDAAEVARIHVLSWQQAYQGLVPAAFLASQSIERRQSYWREAIVKGEPEVWVAKSQGQIVGWIACGPCRDPGAGSQEAEVYAVYLLAHWWSKGVGRALWLAARARLQAQGFATASLWVLAENHRALRFYQAAGFQLEPASAKEVIIGGKPLQELRYVCSLVD